jgi:hypothetical protein
MAIVINFHEQQGNEDKQIKSIQNQMLINNL